MAEQEYPRGPTADPSDPGDDWGEIREDPDEARFELGDLVDDGAPEPEPEPEPKPEPPRSPPPAAPTPPIEERPPAPGPARARAATPAEVADPGLGFDTDPEPFARYRQVERLGILGGKGVGKSYLFQAMVYRVAHARTAGALAAFLDPEGVSLVRSLSREAHARRVNLQRFNGDYERWTRLCTTLATSQPWYRLTLPYRTGFLGLRRAAMEVEFFDGSGEQFFEARDPANRGLWIAAYRDARVMVFCLPLWVPFPAPDLTPAERRVRDDLLESFHEVVQNYRDLRRHLRLRRPVRAILALTMADDRRAGLPALRETWIGPCMQHPQAFLAECRTGRGVARYLAQARQVSGYLHQAFAAAPTPGVAGIPDLLRFDGGRPWLIPVSAIHGEALDALERTWPNPDDRPPRPPPVPVHVELPLLLALCERGNALM